MRLAERDNFSEISPVDICSTLELFAAVRVDSLPISMQPSNSDKIPVKPLRSAQNQALSRVWQLAAEEQKRRDLESHQWSRVMASCNTLLNTDEA